MPKSKWYLSTWLIAIMFSLWFFIIPGVIGVILLILQIKENIRVKKEWEQSGFNDLLKIQEEIQVRTKNINDLEIKKAALVKEIDDLEKKKNEKQDEIVVLDDELLLQSFGFYDPRFKLESSTHYKTRLEQIRDKQKELVKNKQATNHSDVWTLDGSKQKGRVMNESNIKLTLRAFNNECDAAINNLKFTNIHSIEKRIKQSYDMINKANKHNKIEIKKEYLGLKLDELYLAFEYEQKIEEEKEEQRRIKEQMREEQRVLQEIKRMKEKIEKEESHFLQAIEKVKNQLAEASEAQKQDLQNKLYELESKLAELEKEKDSVDTYEQNTRAGYVYIISNIGSFGEDVYKIGMTRRLEPFDRVKELGDASVPFNFDVHAMIFTEDAPKLETALHSSFTHRRVNMVNERKEFFNVSLKEIEEIVRTSHDKVVEFTKLADAQEYRETLKKKEALYKQTSA